MVVRSLKERIRHRFKVSVAETAHQDVWTRAELTVAVVGTDTAYADSVLDSIDRFVERDGRAIVLGRQRDLY